MPKTPIATTKQTNEENQGAKIRATFFGFKPNLIPCNDHFHMIIDSKDAGFTMVTLYGDSDAMLMLAMARLLQELNIDLDDEVTEDNENSNEASNNDSFADSEESFSESNKDESNCSQPEAKTSSNDNSEEDHEQEETNNLRM